MTNGALMSLRRGPPIEKAPRPADQVHRPYEIAVFAAKETFVTKRGWLLNPISLGMKVPEPGATFRLTEPRRQSTRRRPRKAHGG